MSVYLVTIIISIIMSYLAQITVNENRAIVNQDKKHNDIFVFLAAVPLSLVAGLRWRVGTDYWQYSWNYNKYVENFWDDLNGFNEPGINLVAKLSSIIYDDYATMFFIASIITVGLTVNTIAKHSRTLTFSLMLYIFIGAWHGSFNGVRQYLASAIIFTGHHYIINRKFKQYLAIVLIASAFHITALGMILLYFIPMRRLKAKHLLVLAVTSFLITFSNDFLFSIMEIVKGGEFGAITYFTREVNTLRVLVSFAPLLIYTLYTNKYRLKNKDFFYVNMLFINAALTYATSNSAYLMRYAIYTNIFMVLGIPVLYNFKDRYLSFFMKSITIILFLLFWYIEITKTSSLVNYQWIFQR